MKKNICFRIFIILAYFLFCQSYSSSAKEYRIRKMWNCNKLKIGDKIKKTGDTFNDEMVIHWTNARQLMEVQDTSNGVVFKVAQKGFEKNKVKTLLELLTKENSMGHRSFTFGEKYYTEKDYYLADSLHIPVIDIPDSNTILEAFWVCNGEKVITPIRLTEDGKFYIITPAVYGKKSPRDILLNIREREKGQDWINNVYQDIPITYIPVDQ